ncbi:MAG: hypothetical protein AAGM16_16105, partial [Pseudomonadota bacterium]
NNVIASPRSGRGNLSKPSCRSAARQRDEIVASLLAMTGRGRQAEQRHCEPAQRARQSLKAIVPFSSTTAQRDRHVASLLAMTI